MRFIIYLHVSNAAVNIVARSALLFLCALEYSTLYTRSFPAFDLSNTLLVPSVTSSFIPNAVNVLTYCHAQVGVCGRGGGAGREPKRGAGTWRVS